MSRDNKTEIAIADCRLSTVRSTIHHIFSVSFSFLFLFFFSLSVSIFKCKDSADLWPMCNAIFNSFHFGLYFRLHFFFFLSFFLSFSGFVFHSLLLL